MEVSYPRSDGTYFLATFSECEGGHHGAFEGRSIYVVGRGTDKERLFASESLAAAADYSNQLEPRMPIEKLSSTTLCSEAVVALYEGRLTYA